MNLNCVSIHSTPSLPSGTCLGTGAKFGRSYGLTTCEVHELTDTQLEKLDNMHSNTIKAFLGLPSRGPTPTILHSTDGLGFPRISEL